MTNSKCIVVTGAAAGLGRDLSIAFAKRGLAVVMVDINAAGLGETSSACEPHSASLLTVVADLTDEGSAQRIVDATLRRFSRIDYLVNCAAIGDAEAFFDMSARSWQRTFSINVTAMVMLTVRVADAMRHLGNGRRITNITSPASRMALPNYAAYAASKAAVDSFTRCASVALARHGIRVNSIAPGMMDTEMQRLVEAGLARLEGRTDIEQFLHERTQRVPIGRRAEIAEVVDSVVWLTLDAPNYVTCARFNVSGGLDKD